MMPRNLAKLASRTAQHLFVAGLFLFIATPVLVIVVFSFDANRFPTIPLGGFSLEWHRQALADAMIRDALLNSAAVATATAAIATMLGFAAAYIDYRYVFRGRSAFGLLVAIPPAVPVSIMGMAMLAFLSRIGLFGSVTAIVVCHVAISASFAMAIIRLRLADFPRDMEPAAWNLGASPFATLFAVVLPFCRSALIASFFLCAAVSFDEFLIAWFVGGTVETLPVRILNLLQGQVNPKINAIGTIVLVISVALVLVAQRFVSLRASRANPSA